MSGSSAPAPLFFLIAGEPSGDGLGGRLMAALKRLGGAGAGFAGVGGPHMEAEGLRSLFPMAELSVMGLAEVLPHLPRLIGRIGEVVDEIRRIRPAAVITIDSPGFNVRVAKRLKGEGIPLIHYVAPSVWAWRPGRAAKLAPLYDHLLALLPFEPPYFERVGLPCTFVGHPVVESGAERGNGEAFRRRHGIAAAAPLLAVLPGSRRGETDRLLSVFGATLALLKRSHPSLCCVVPTLSAVAADVGRAARAWPVPSVVTRDEGEKYDGFAAADAALAASGTVALELAMARTPQVIAYRMSPLTGWLARRLVRIPSVSLVNIVMERSVVPEFLQGECRAENLAPAIEHLLAGGGGEQIAASAEALRRLGYGGPSPSERAARAALDVVARSRQT